MFLQCQLNLKYFSYNIYYQRSVSLVIRMMAINLFNDIPSLDMIYLEYVRWSIPISIRILRYTISMVDRKAIPNKIYQNIFLHIVLPTNSFSQLENFWLMSCMHINFNRHTTYIYAIKKCLDATFIIS